MQQEREGWRRLLRLAEAHTSKAHALMHMLQWQRAEGEFQRAIGLDPSYLPARYFYAELLAARGRKAESIKEAREGLASDPSSAIATHQVGVMLYFSRDYTGRCRISRKRWRSTRSTTGHMDGSRSCTNGRSRAATSSSF